MGGSRGGHTVGGFPTAHLGNLKTLIQFIHGHGSGIDADTVDGLHGSDLIKQTDVVTSPSANKILKLDGNGKLPGDITGNAGGAGRTYTRGPVAMETGTSLPSVSGLTMTEAYRNGHPITYGNVMTMHGAGQGQLLIGWSGTSSTDGVTIGSHENSYIRSKRDNANSVWSPWAKIWTDANHGSGSGLSADNVRGYVPVNRTGDSMTGSLTLAGNAELLISNPNASTASFNLGWLNNAPRIRISGTGAGVDAEFTIQGPGDVVRFGVDANGNGRFTGELSTVGTLSVGNKSNPATKAFMVNSAALSYVGNAASFKSMTDTSDAFTIMTASNSRIMSVNTSSGRMGIGYGTDNYPRYTVDVKGDISATSTIVSNISKISDNGNNYNALQRVPLQDVSGHSFYANNEANKKTGHGIYLSFADTTADYIKNFTGGSYNDITEVTKTYNKQSTPILQNNSSYLYVGSFNTFDGVYIDTATNGAGYTISVDYWNGTTWVAVDAYKDNTNHLTRSGWITFNNSSSWDKNKIESSESLVNYWIRIKTSTNPSRVCAVQTVDLSAFSGNFIYCSNARKNVFTVDRTGALEALTLRSTVRDASPIFVESQVNVTNLNADMVDGIHGSAIVQTSRRIDTGAGITGGGDLSGNRTFSFDTTWGDNRYVNKSGDTINGKLVVNGGGGGFCIKPGTTDHAYMEFYARTSNSNTRSGYLGFGGEASSTMSVTNEISGGQLNLGTIGGGIVTVNDNRVLTTADLSGTVVQPGRKLIAGNGISGGGDLSGDRTFSFDTTWGDKRYANISGQQFTGNISFNAHDKGIALSYVANGTTPTVWGSGAAITGGSDYAGLDKINNVAVQTWYGFSVSNTIDGQPISKGKPAFSVNARTGDVYAYRYNTVSSQWWTTAGTYGMNMSNSDVIGLNNLFWADECEGDSEGLQFPKTGKAGSRTFSDYDTVRALDGRLLFNSNMVDVIESAGYNANGNYVRYASGLQICWLRTEGSVTAYTWLQSATNAGNYWYTNMSWTFPAAFYNNGRTYLGLFASGDIAGAAMETHQIYFKDYTYAMAEAGVLSDSAPSSGTLARTFMAIGHWK